MKLTGTSTTSLTRRKKEKNRQDRKAERKGVDVGGRDSRREEERLTAKKTLIASRLKYPDPLRRPEIYGPVSRALLDHPGVTEQTLEHVQSLIDQLAIELRASLHLLSQGKFPGHLPVPGPGLAGLVKYRLDKLFTSADPVKDKVLAEIERERQLMLWWWEELDKEHEAIPPGSPAKQYTQWQYSEGCLPRLIYMRVHPERSHAEGQPSLSMRMFLMFAEDELRDKAAHIQEFYRRLCRENYGFDLDQHLQDLQDRISDNG